MGLPEKVAGLLLPTSSAGGDWGGAIASDLVSGQGGIAAKVLSKSVTEKEGNALVKDDAFSYRASERVAVEGYFRNPGTAPWLAAGAVLRGLRGEVLKPVLLWLPDPIRPAAPGEASDRECVVVEVLATEVSAWRTTPSA